MVQPAARVLDWTTPVNLVAEEAIFLLDGPAGFPGRLTVLSDGIELKTLMKTGRWQFWKIQAIEIVSSGSRQRVAITFRPDLSGEGDIGIEPQDRDTQALWSRLSAAYHRWLDSDLGREQVSTRDGKPSAGGPSPVSTPTKALVFLFHLNFDDQGIPSLLSDREPYEIVDASYRAVDDPSPTASAPRVYWSHGAPVAVGKPVKPHYVQTVNANGLVIDSFPIDFGWRRSLGPAYFRVPYSVDVQSFTFYHADGRLLFAVKTITRTEGRQPSVATASPTAPPPITLGESQSWLTNLPATTALITAPSSGELRITFDGPKDLNGLEAALRWDGQVYRGTTFRAGCVDGTFTLRLAGAMLVGDVERPSCGNGRGMRQGIVLRPRSGP